MPIPSPRPVFLLLLLCGVAVCTAARVQRLQLPVPTSETIPYVAREMGAATYEESIESDDSVPASSKKRIQRKLVTGIEDINGNSEYTEYQGVMGRPGVDFPVLPSIPQTDFSCRNIKSSGYYADLDTDCQVFHICDGGRKISFLCPNGTIFRQSHLICDWWFRVDCGRSVELYEESAEQLAADQRIYKERAEAIAKAMQRGSQIEQAKAEPSVKSYSTTPSPRENFRQGSFNDNSNSQNKRFNSAQNGNYNQEKKSNIVYQQIRRRPRPQNTFNEQSSARPQNNFNNQPPSAGPQNNFNQQSSEFQGQQNYPQYTNTASIRNNPPPKQEEERQQLAETASFASNRGNRFGNQFYQQNYYKQQSTQPTPTNNDKIFPTNNKIYVDINRNRAQQPSQFPPITTTLFPQRGPQNQFFDNVASSIFRRPAQQNNFRGNFASSTSPTVVRQNYQNSAFRTPQRSQNQFVQNNFERNTQRQQASQENLSASTTQRPIFTLKFKPNKSFSYVELHRAKSPTVTSTFAPISNKNIISKVSFSSEEKNPSPSSVDSTFVSATQKPLSSSSVSTKANIAINTTVSTINNVTQNKNLLNSLSTPPSIQTTNGVTVSNIPISSVDVSNYESISSPSTTENSVYISSTLFSTKSISSNGSTVTYSGSTTEPSTSASLISNYVTPPSVTQYPDIDIIYNVSESQVSSFDDVKPEDVNSLTNKPTRFRGNIRHGLKIPTSSGPKALHSLSLYYATSESDIGATTEYTTTEQSTEKVSVSELLLRSHSGSPDSELEIDEAQPTPDSKVAVKDLTAVLTKATKDSYTFLFGNNTSDSSTDKPVSEINDELDTQFVHSFSLKDHNTIDLDSEQSRGIVQPTTNQPTTTLSSEDLPDEKKLRDSTDLRELAQVFSRALSAYLEDPDSFRRVLSEVRPTEPTTLGTDSTTLSSSEENEDEVLDFSDVSNSSPIRTVPTSALSHDSEDKVNKNGFIDEINSLVYQQKDNLTSDIFPVTAPADTTYQPQTTQYTSPIPTSIAADVNYFLSFSNNSYDGLTNDFPQNDGNSYFPTAGSVNDGSRPRYGGFSNNSDPEVTTHYSPYGAEVAANLTGFPLHETYPTLPTEVAKPTQNAQSLTSEFSSGKILEHSIPDHVIEAQDVNALQENRNIYSTVAPSTGHYITSSDVFTKSAQVGRTITEQDLYSPPTDQEKLLIASGSQSIVSQDNYIKYVNSKQESGKNTQNLNSYIDVTDLNDKHEHHLQSSQVTAGSFGSRQRVNHGVTFQSVNLGNGVTIERTKTIRYTTPPDSYWTIPPILNNDKEELTPLSLNNELSALKDKPVNTEYPETNPPQWFGPESVQATTYHPLIAQPEVNQPAIPPRSSQKSSWQWNLEPNSTVETTTIADETTQSYYATTLKENEAFPTAAADEIQYLSTLLPKINTDTPSFENKAKEMFGNLNESTAKTLMDMMYEAESNMTLRRLVLLLVAANGQENRSAEESRSQLIQALLKVPEDNQKSTTIPHSTMVARSTTVAQSTIATVSSESTESVRKRTRGGRNRGTPLAINLSTTPLPKQTGHRSRGTKTYRGVDSDTAIITSLRRPVQRLPSDVDNPGALTQLSDPESDTRAVELLKSLYNLAARWG